MSGSTSDQVKSILAAGVKAIFSNVPGVQIGTQVLSHLCSSSKSTPHERQVVHKKNDSVKTNQSYNKIESHVQDAIRIINPAMEIAKTLHKVYMFIKPSSSVNSNNTSCYSRRSNGAHSSKETNGSASCRASQIGEPVSQKEKNLKQFVKKEMQPENEPRCDICRAKSDVRQLGLSPCQHIFCYNCLVLITKCTVCRKPFRRDDFLKIT